MEKMKQWISSWQDVIVVRRVGLATAPVVSE